MIGWTKKVIQHITPKNKERCWKPLRRVEEKVLRLGHHSPSPEPWTGLKVDPGGFHRTQYVPGFWRQRRWSGRSWLQRPESCFPNLPTRSPNSDAASSKPSSRTASVLYLKEEAKEKKFCTSLCKVNERFKIFWHFKLRFLSHWK